MFKTKYHFSSVKFHFGLIEDPMLAQVVVKITAIHQVQDEAELIRRVEGIRHTDDKWAIHLIKSAL